MSARALPSASTNRRALLGVVRGLPRRGAGEALFALAVLGLVILLVTPLSPGALDALVTLDLAASALLLSAALFAQGAHPPGQLPHPDPPHHAVPGGAERRLDPA